MNIPKPSEVFKKPTASRSREAKSSGIQLTDTTNAERIIELYGDQVRFDHKRKRWLIWQGHRWQPDTDQIINRYAVEATRKLYQDAEAIEDTKKRMEVAKWAILSESKAKVDATLGMLKSLLPVADKGEDWDKDNMLLSCPNGIVDLVAGELRDGLPEDRITMTTRVNFNEEAECPRWELFINQIFEGKEDIISFVQKALGYSITGSTKEQAAFFCYGTGSNGKSVLFKTICEILGDYAYNAPASLLKRYPLSSASNDEASTEFKRFLVLSETLATSKINEERLKKWTGGDRVTARYLYQENFTFEPTVKPWLFINHKPQVEDDSYAFWRRVRAIPFNRKFEGDEDDKDLPQKLLTEAEGILAWLVKGCLLWQEESLGNVPEEIQEATSVYRSENDELFDFTSEAFIEKKDSAVKASEAYREYLAWATKQGYKSQDILGSKNFGIKMADKFVKKHLKVGNCYLGEGWNPKFEASDGLTPLFYKTPTREIYRNSLLKTTSVSSPGTKTTPDPSPKGQKPATFEDLKQIFDLKGK